MEPKANGSWYTRNQTLLILVLVAILLLLIEAILVYTTAPHPSTAAQVFIAVLPSIAAVPIVSAVLMVIVGASRAAVPALESPESSEFFEDVVARLKPSVSAGNVLRTREELPPMSELTAGVKSISILAISGSGLSNRFAGAWANCIRSGAKVRVLLLDPHAPGALGEWDRLSNPPMVTPDEDIRRSIKQFGNLYQAGGRGSFELRVTDTLLPYSLIWFDYGDESTVQVEVHFYHRPPDERPNIFVTTQDSPHWTALFAAQFDHAWADSKDPDPNLLR